MVSSLRLTEISKLRRWNSGGGGGGSSRVTSPSAAAAAPAPAPACPRGHFAAYTRDGSRFFVPIACLGSDIFRELLNMAEEEFGAPGDRPIVLPCSAACLEQILAALRAGGAAGKKCTGAGAAGWSKIW